MADRLAWTQEAARGVPITDLRDEDSCSAQLVQWLHLAGLACPCCPVNDRTAVQRRQRAPILDFRCGRVFHAVTGTILHGLRRRANEAPQPEAEVSGRPPERADDVGKPPLGAG